MSDDSSKPALGAVSPRRAFAAQISWESFPEARAAFPSPSKLPETGELIGSVIWAAIPSERTRQSVLRRKSDREKIPVAHPSKISSLHSGSRVEALAEE